MAYIEGARREQQMLFPATLDEYVGENNEVRAIAAFVEHLDFGEMGFERSEPAAEGRPGYDPRTLLGIFIWGHLNGVRTSRRLERECGRCVELMWLSGLLKPDFKTLCRFRQGNKKAISKIMVQFRVLCEGAGLFGKELVAIDGSKFKAVNSTQRNVTPKKLAAMIKREEEAVEKYLADLEQADAEDEGESRELSAEELKKKIASLSKSLEKNKGVLEEMKASGEKRRSLTDPDSRLMRTSKGTNVCYNVQAIVDSKHKLLVDLEVTNEAADKVLLPEMAQRAKEELGVEELTVVADGGYFSHEAIKACEDRNITAFVPIRDAKDAERMGIFSREEFKYDETQDVYVCPAGAVMRRNSKYVRKDTRLKKEFYLYTTKACGLCPMKALCTTSKTGRKIKRWAYTEVLDKLKERLEKNPDVIRQRKGLVEHPFGIIKIAMNHERLLTRGIANVSTEMKLAALSYNFKRVLSILGIEKMIEMIRSQRPGPQVA